ncbi:MAG: hypothetical protein H0W20_17025, partial [Chthoniobacterales bacterium]|nr:hypothetical protein [Chthoniobacterales bacterium]
MPAIYFRRLSLVPAVHPDASDRRLGVYGAFEYNTATQWEQRVGATYMIGCSSSSFIVHPSSFLILPARMRAASESPIHSFMPSVGTVDLA